MIVADAAPPTCTVDRGCLRDLLVEGHHPSREEDDAEADLPPQDDEHHRPERQRGITDPVERQDLETHPPEGRVDRSVQLDHVAEHGADDRDGEDVGHEQDGPVEAVAGHAVVEHGGHEQGTHHHDGDREEQQGAVGDRFEEQRVGGDAPVVVEPDEGPTGSADAPGAEVEDRQDGIAEHEQQQQDHGREIQERRQPTRAQHRLARTCSSVRHPRSGPGPSCTGSSRKPGTRPSPRRPRASRCGPWAPCAARRRTP